MRETAGNVTRFRGRLFIVIILAVVLVTLIGVIVARHQLNRISKEEFLSLAEQRVEAAEQARKVRQFVLAEICADLARQPRIHAALEDDALDLLYPSAANELRQLMREFPLRADGDQLSQIQARFYRFLDASGKVIHPIEDDPHGWLPDTAESEISLEKLPDRQEIAYIRISDRDGQFGTIEVITVPIISMETIEPISALVVGFPYEREKTLPANPDIFHGMVLNGRTYVDGFDEDSNGKLSSRLTSLLALSEPDPVFEVAVNGVEYYGLLQQINKGSAYPPVYGIYLSSLEPLVQRQAKLNQGIFLMAGILLVVGLLSAHVSASKLSRPVEALAEASQDEHKQRISAELALNDASRELERAARFSADASHQLKTPVAVMRAGLEELRVAEDFPEELDDEVNALINQTGRLTRVIEDLLLLSQLDAGSLKIQLQPVNLYNIVDGLVDDMSVLPEHEQIDIEVSVDPELMILGNRTYTSLIFQSLLENARKYNCPGGRIRIDAEVAPPVVHCRIGNTGKGIHPSIQSQIFERFHRGDSGENVAGYGLGLNLAMELTRLHGGELELLSSDKTWTEFQLSLQSAPSLFHH